MCPFNPPPHHPNQSAGCGVHYSEVAVHTSTPTPRPHSPGTSRDRCPSARSRCPSASPACALPYLQFSAMVEGPCPLPQTQSNALLQWQTIEQRIQGKELVVFLDYDGTLSPIVSEPERAFMKESMRPVLEQVASMYITAIVTGRSKDKIYKFVQLDEIFYASSHGLEIKGPVSRPVQFQMAEKFRPCLEAAMTELFHLVETVPGVEIEDNMYSVSVHYRNCTENAVPVVHDAVLAYAEQSPVLAVKEGKKVFELRPKIDWNKGSAVQFILEALGLSNAENICPVYLGDDLSDEDAFLAVKSLSSPGISVLVREDTDAERPAETNAIYKLRNPDEVEVFLRRLIEMKKVATATATAATTTSFHAPETAKVVRELREIHIHSEVSITTTTSDSPPLVALDQHLHGYDRMSPPSAAIPEIDGVVQD